MNVLKTHSNKLFMAALLGIFATGVANASGPAAVPVTRMIARSVLGILPSSEYMIRSAVYARIAQRVGRVPFHGVAGTVRPSDKIVSYDFGDISLII